MKYFFDYSLLYEARASVLLIIVYLYSFHMAVNKLDVAKKCSKIWLSTYAVCNVAIIAAVMQKTEHSHIKSTFLFLPLLTMPFVLVLAKDYFMKSKRQINLSFESVQIVTNILFLLTIYRIFLNIDVAEKLDVLFALMTSVPALINLLLSFKSIQKLRESKT
jgi:hypothetical protein